MRRTAFTALMLALGPATQAGALEIVAPLPGTLVAPGQVMTFKVAPSAGETIAELAFVTSDGVTQAPAGAREANVRIPLDAVGSEFVVAQAILADGKLAAAFVELEANPGPLEELTVLAPPALASIGEVAQLEVFGRFRDGVVRDLTHPERGTTYTTSAEGVLGVDPTGLLQARSRGTAQVLVSNRGKVRIVTIAVRVPSPPVNRIPIPDAGADQVVAPETLVRLDGSASRDPDGDPLRYRWRQETGRPVVMRDPDTARPYFVSPRVTAEQILEFSLVVIDSRDAMSFRDIVRVVVRP
ncbi:MAG TPA: PKD domain-containing protein [Vicinamibacterales bacterium]|nr:PKD domain-containing protein [Vicinamibacterales bacterium]